EAGICRAPVVNGGFAFRAGWRGPPPGGCPAAGTAGGVGRCAGVAAGPAGATGAKGGWVGVVLCTDLSVAGGLALSVAVRLLPGAARRTGCRIFGAPSDLLALPPWLSGNCFRSRWTAPQTRCV